MTEILIENTLRQELITNSLCLTQTQIDWIEVYLNISSDMFLPLIGNLVTNISNDFHLENIPQFILDLVGIIQNGNVDMTLIFIKFIVKTLIDNGIIPISQQEDIIKVHSFVNSYIELSNNNLPIEEQTSIWENMNSLLCA